MCATRPEVKCDASMREVRGLTQSLRFGQTCSRARGKTHEDCVFAEAKMMKSCALSAALLDGLHHCGLSLVTQTMHKEQMRITERNQMEAWGLRLQGADGPQATLLYGAAQWFLLPFAR